MPTIYIPDEMLEEVRLMKHYRHQRKKYNIILDFKEETRQEEKVPPCTPFIKEEKKKEERDIYIPRSRENSLSIPTLEEVREYAKGFENLTFTADFFFHYYDAYGWKSKGETVYNWQSLFTAWANDPKKCHASRSQRTEARQQRLLSAETQRLEQSNREIAEREARQAREASQAVSYEEYQRMKQAGELGETVGTE